MKRIEEIENYSISSLDIEWLHRQFKSLTSKHYTLLDYSVGGDAPKDFIKAYIYGDSRKAKRGKWAKYIAKVGHKWYPIESINEYLLNRIGETLGLKMAKSHLVLADKQIRFLSLYFTKKDEELVHGANIYSSCLNEKNNTFVQHIEDQNLSRELFTFQFTLEAIEFAFPENHENITLAFVKMLLFDAITGNNDRHFFNWGVLRDIRENRKPQFAPVYDSARGLFWNDSEEKIKNLFLDETKPDMEGFNKYLDRYIRRSFPKIGWEGEESLNHFDLIKKIFATYPLYLDNCEQLLTDEALSRILVMLNREFRGFFSKKRLILIEECLKRRFSILQSIVNQMQNND